MNTIVQKNIWKLKSLVSLSQITFHVPIWVLFFMSKGLSLWDVALLYTAMLTFQIILEVPSGIMADKYGQKSVLIIAGILNLLVIT